MNRIETFYHTLSVQGKDAKFIFVARRLLKHMKRNVNWHDYYVEIYDFYLSKNFKIELMSAFDGTKVCSIVTNIEKKSFIKFNIEEFRRLSKIRPKLYR